MTLTEVYFYGGTASFFAFCPGSPGAAAGPIYSTPGGHIGLFAGPFLNPNAVFK